MSFIEREYICNKEKYLEIKELQKKIALEIKSFNSAEKAYYEKRRNFYHSKKINVPNDYEKFHPEWYSFDTKTWLNLWKRDGFMEEKPIYSISESPRYLNVIYSLLKGKEYNQIEAKIKKGNELNKYIIEEMCSRFKIDINKIKEKIYG